MQKHFRSPYDPVLQNILDGRKLYCLLKTAQTFSFSDVCRLRNIRQLNIIKIISLDILQHFSYPQIVLTLKCLRYLQLIFKFFCQEKTNSGQILPDDKFKSRRFLYDRVKCTAKPLNHMRISNRETAQPENA